MLNLTVFVMMKQIKLFLCTLLAMLMLLPTGAYALTIHTVTSTFNGMDVCRDQEMEPNRTFMFLAQTSRFKLLKEKSSEFIIA